MKIGTREISDASGIDIEAVRKAIQRGRLDSGDLCSVAVYVVVSRLKRMSGGEADGS